jgi:anaerobic magnesium-protoporphyrin IX monomethyl ester cyclase
VLLVNPSSPFLVDSRTFPPLGLLYLGAALEANGHHATVVDLAFPDVAIKGHNPDLIGVMCLTPHFPQMDRLMGELRREYPSVPIVVGGPHFSTVPSDGERIGADAVGTGDCEETIQEIVGAASRGELHGQVFRTPGGITDVNKYPIPARHLLPIHQYIYRIAGEPATTLIRQRGCPYVCTFCAHFEGYTKLRVRDIENVITEVRQLKAEGFKALFFFDDELNIVHKRTIELAEALKPEGIKWRSFIKANLFNEEQAKAFADSGCWELCTGVEAGDDAILKTIQKKATVADNTRVVQLCKKYGIRVKAFCQIGHPGESLESVMALKRWLIENAPSELNISLHTPYLGTPVVEHPEKFDIKFESLDYSREEYFYRGKPGEYQGHVSTSHLSAEDLVRLRFEVERDVREALGLPPQGDPATWNIPTPRTREIFREEECRG